MSWLPGRSWRWATTRRPALRLYLLTAVDATFQVYSCRSPVWHHGCWLPAAQLLAPPPSRQESAVASRHSKRQAVLPLEADATAMLAPAASHTSRGSHKTARPWIQVAQVSLTNPCDTLRHDKLSHVTINTPLLLVICHPVARIVYKIWRLWVQPWHILWQIRKNCGDCIIS